MSKVRERLKNKATGSPPPPKPAAAPAPSAPAPVDDKKEAPADPPAAKDDEDDLMETGLDDKPDDKAPEAKKDDQAPAADDKKKEKVNPWKVVEEHKAKRAELERENLELKKLVPNAEVRKSELAQVESLRKRNEELEKQIQFVDYQSSEEYKTKYEKPYKDQWKSSMKDLKGVVAETDNGERELNAEDMVALVNMSTVQARREATERFGDYANDVMIERDKIRATWDAQQKALEDAKVNGHTKSQEAQRAHTEGFQKLNGEVHEIYTKAVEAISKDPKIAEFITPRAGDPKQGEILTKGFALVDDAFQSSPMDPALTEEQRRKVVKKHAAVRFRTAAYGVMKYDLNRERAAHAETKRKLAEYEGTVPNRGGSEAVAPSGGGSSKMAQMQARLRARAK